MATYGLTISSAPATTPITTAEAKTHLRVDHDDENDLIDSLIEAATDQLQVEWDRAFVTQTWALTLDEFPSASEVIHVPRPPLASVTSIVYTDSDGNTDQTFSSASYVVDTSHTPGRIALANGESWPGIYNEIAPMLITYVAGYGAAAAVPDGIKAAIKLVVAHWYENREAVITGTISTELPMAVQRLGQRFNAKRYA